MVEFIARDAVKLALAREFAYHAYAGEAACAVVDKIPAADVRPVVLCRDCEYYQADCGWCGLHDIGMNVNGFCSNSAKREESNG